MTIMDWFLSKKFYFLFLILLKKSFIVYNLDSRVETKIIWDKLKNKNPFIKHLVISTI